METSAILEIIGYLASVIIAISLLMKSLIRLRVLNGIGALVFVIYGALIKAYPVAVLNGIIVFIDLYYLLKMIKRSDYFTLMEISPQSAYLAYFIDFHIDDIQKFFPQFNFQANQADLAFFVLRDAVPAGVVVLRKKDHQGTVLLDYALEDYRDLKIGSFIFDDNADILLAHGIDFLETYSSVPIHIRYLKQMDFIHMEDDRFTKVLTPHYIRDKKI
jgi:hypothetical protein